MCLFFDLISTKQTISEAYFIKEKQELSDRKMMMQATTAFQQYHLFRNFKRHFTIKIKLNLA